MARILKEGMDYLDLKGQITPELGIDEYQAQMGSDDEIVTCSFVVKGQQPAEDLVDWLEKGYDWILDAQVSSGEITSGKFVVFVEMNRRTKVPERIYEMLEDLEVLTGQLIEEWAIIIEGKKYPVEVEALKRVIILSPQDYRAKKEMEVGEDHPGEEAEKEIEAADVDKELSEMRNVAGLSNDKVVTKQKPDSLLRDYLAKAGL